MRLPLFLPRESTEYIIMQIFPLKKFEQLQARCLPLDWTVHVHCLRPERGRFKHYIYTIYIYYILDYNEFSNKLWYHKSMPMCMCVYNNIKVSIWVGKQCTNSEGQMSEWINDGKNIFSNGGGGTLTVTCFLTYKHVRTQWLNTCQQLCRLLKDDGSQYRRHVYQINGINEKPQRFLVCSLVDH